MSHHGHSVTRKTLTAAHGAVHALRDPQGSAGRRSRVPAQDAAGAADGQHWNPDRYRRCASFVPELGRDLVDLLDPRPGERVLDLGCGDGTLTVRLAERGCTVIGVDRSAAFVAAACRRGLEVVAGDARRLHLTGLPAGGFDGVFSNAVLHWIRQPVAVIRGVHRVLRRGGRYVAEFGGAGNIATVRRALHRALRRHGIDPVPRDPWYFPTAEAYRDLLEARGFSVPEMRLFSRPTRVPGSLTEWLQTLATPLLAGLDRDTRRQVAAEVEAATAPYLRDADGAWTVDYVRLRFRAVKR